MAELFVLGQIIGARNFPQKSLFCKWAIHAGAGWKLIAGQKEGQTQVDTPAYDEVTYWCHPLDLHFATKGIPGWPKLHVQVYHYDEFGRSQVCAYGYVYVPTAPGTHHIELHTWKPTGSLLERISEYFVGGGPVLRSSDTVYTGFDRYRLCTEPAGVVLFELSALQKDFRKFRVETH